MIQKASATPGVPCSIRMRLFPGSSFRDLSAAYPMFATPTPARCTLRDRRQRSPETKSAFFVRSSERAFHSLDPAWRYLVLGSMAILAALVIVTLGMAQAALRRANRELSERAEALSQANTLLAEQIEERAKAEEQLRQSQKMQALGQLTGGIAHDFNNLLTVIQGSADILSRDELADDRRKRFARAIVQAAENAAVLTSQLLAFARRQPLKPELVDLSQLVGSMTELIDRTMGERIKIKTKLDRSACPVLVDRNQLQSAILNVASNARDAMPDGGTLSIVVSGMTSDCGERMSSIAITDTGTGMDPETASRIFEPFFTTKKTGQGTGLGLSQVLSIREPVGR